MANLLLLGTALFIAFLLGYILRCMFCKHRNGVGGFSGKRLWVLLLAILWALLSLWWYACKIKNMCDASATAAAPAVVTAPAAPVVAATPEPVAPPQPPIAFAWSSATAVTTPDFDAIKAKVVGDLPDGKMLHIVGQYYNGEENDSKYPDIGVARAVDAAKQFVGSVDENRILVSSENLGDYSGDKSAMLPAVKFGYADMPEPQAAAPAAPAFPLAFGWSSSDPQATADFDAIKARLIGDMGADKALRITGRYYADENNDSTYDNLGLARAAKIREMFIADADKNRVLIAGEMLEGGIADQNAAFEAAKFEIIPLDDAGFKVKEAGDHRIIYFPFNSHASSVDSNLENYLAGLAKELVDGGKSIRIVGHTDSQGDAAYNRHLGMLRARMVGDLLMKHGVRRGSIDMESKGEDEPVADNSTDKGRAENRRVELFIQ